MNLIYRVERKNERLFVSVCEKGSSRLLYLSSLVSYKEEKELLSLLTRIQMQKGMSKETLSFNQIAIPSKYLAEVVQLLKKSQKVVGQLEPLEKPPLKVTPEIILSDPAGISCTLWMDYGVEKMEFDDFSPTVDQRPRLKKEEMEFEKDLLEAGYIKRHVGNGKYYCPQEKVKEALSLLFDIGWSILDVHKEKIDRGITVFEENGRIAVRAKSRVFLDQNL